MSHFPTLVSRLFHLSRPRQDFLIASVLTGGVYLASWHLNIAERFSAWAEQYEHIQIDELAVALLFAALASAWFSRRRILDLRQETLRRNLAEQAENQAREKFKTLFDESLCGNFICTRQGDVMLCNEAFEIMSGRTGNHLKLPEALGERWPEITTQLENAGKSHIDHLVLSRPDDAPWVVMASFVMPEPHPGQEREIHGFFADITELHLAEKELADLLEENRALALHAGQVEEEERRRIAREIHDDMGQYLTAIQLDAATLSMHGADNVAERSRNIMNHARHIQKTVHGLIRQLRPVLLDEHGLPDAVRHMAGQWGRQHPGTFCAVYMDNCRDLPEPVAAVAYRTIQEALTNVARHANASSVTITLRNACTETGNDLVLEISDNGVGFSTAKKNNGFGLIGMRERIESVRGIFSIQSKEGAGVTLRAQLPLNLQEST